MVLDLKLFSIISYHHPPYIAVSMDPVVRFEHMRTLSDSTQSQEFNFYIGSRNRMQQCALGPILRHNLYVWCPRSNLCVWDHFWHLQNFRIPNLIFLASFNYLNSSNSPNTLFQLVDQSIHGLYFKQGCCVVLHCVAVQSLVLLSCDNIVWWGT